MAELPPIPPPGWQSILKQVGDELVSGSTIIFLRAEQSYGRQSFLKLLEAEISGVARMLSLKKGSPCLNQLAAQLNLWRSGVGAADLSILILKSLQERINDGERIILLAEDADQF